MQNWGAAALDRGCTVGMRRSQLGMALRLEHRGPGRRGTWGGGEAERAARRGSCLR